MKVRTDFVTNSSSVSYIITMNRDIVNVYNEIRSRSRTQEISRIVEFLENYLLDNGTRIYLDEEEMFFKKVRFRTDGDMTDKEQLESDGSEVDFSSMSEEELLSYIYGEYIYKNKLGEIEGFGSTMVETF